MSRYLFVDTINISTSYGTYTIYEPFISFPDEDEDVYVYNMDILIHKLCTEEVTNNMINITIPTTNTLSWMTVIQKQRLMNGLLINKNQFKVTL